MSRVLGVPARAVLPELRREIREVRSRWMVMRAAARGASVVSGVTIDRGTLVLSRPNSVVSGVTIIGLSPRGECRCRACQYLRGSIGVLVEDSLRRQA